MPEKPLTIAAYAAGASLAAVTLVYVFGPTFFFDDEAANSSRASRKRGVVGLVNPANDCFINSVLQALAGLPELRLYLIRETHRRKLDGPEIYAQLYPTDKEDGTRLLPGSEKQLPGWRIIGLQQGLVTAGLKDVIDALNERPIYRKILSAQSFIRVVEQAFRTRISRSQQDAQEFLQVIAERVADEHYAGKRARKRARRRPFLVDPTITDVNNASAEDEHINVQEALAREELAVTVDTVDSEQPKIKEVDDLDDDDDDVDHLDFPFEGKLESQVECEFCHFKPRPTISSFVTLTLHVPQTSGATTLNACFDGMLKIEHIDDFTCDRCRLDHALQLNGRQLSKTSLTDEQRRQLESDRDKLQIAINDDPEVFPPGVNLPELSTAPKRRISRHMRIASFPRILAVHLNRSVWDAQTASSKNLAKVSFPERLPLGGLLDRKNYRLLGVVTHKGGHDSGHYESFRRQFLSPPYSTPANMGTEGIYSLRSSPVPSPVIAPTPGQSPPFNPSTLTSTSQERRSADLSSSDRKRRPWNTPSSVPFDAIPTPGLPTPPQSMESVGRMRSASISSAMNLARKRQGKGPDRWWRISDEKIKECKTSELLAMQREVYLLFYEIMEDHPHAL